MASSRVPFPERVALNRLILSSQHGSSRANSSHQLSGGRGVKNVVDFLPGCPDIALSGAEVSQFMQKKLRTPILDEIHPKLWLVARQSYSNIDPFHLQASKGRTIFLTENPQLHLLWQQDRIYIKPIPFWLVNYQVWLQYLCPTQGETNPPERAAAIGFLRSYSYLIQHHSDFIIAHQQHLLPPNVDWVTWSQFMACFHDIEDHQISKRYHYGQLRLSRLHWAVRVFHPPSATSWWFYYLPYWSITPYLQKILAPLVFAFATISLVLSAIQVLVSLHVDDLGLSWSSLIGLETMRKTFWVFSTSILVISSVIWMLLFVIPIAVILWQLLWGFRHRNTALVAL